MGNNSKRISDLNTKHATNLPTEKPASVPYADMFETGTDKDLMFHYLQASKERIRASEILLKDGLYKDSVNRSYYAIFYAVKAVLVGVPGDYKKHSGVIAAFQKEFVKPGIFEVKFSKYLQNAFQIRNTSDYNVFYIVAHTDAEEQLQHAKEFLARAEFFISEKDRSSLPEA